MLKFRGITGPKSAQYTLKWAAAVSHGIPRICRGEPRNLANGAAEIGKICCGKLWALYMTHQFTPFQMTLSDIYVY